MRDCARRAVARVCSWPRPLALADAARAGDFALAPAARISGAGGSRRQSDERGESGARRAGCSRIRGCPSPAGTPARAATIRRAPSPMAWRVRAARRGEPLPLNAPTLAERGLQPLAGLARRRRTHTRAADARTAVQRASARARPRGPRSRPSSARSRRTPDMRDRFAAAFPGAGARHDGQRHPRHRRLRAHAVVRRFALRSLCVRRRTRRARCDSQKRGMDAVLLRARRLRRLSRRHQLRRTPGWIASTRTRRPSFADTGTGRDRARAHAAQPGGHRALPARRPFRRRSMPCSITTSGWPPTLRADARLRRAPLTTEERAGPAGIPRLADRTAGR